MFGLPIAFAAPWLLIGLIALPVLWWLLRAVPPAPIRRLFPAVTLLLGLEDRETQADRTPWWLLMLRLLAIAAMILGFAGPVLNPDDKAPGRGPLLVFVDAAWPAAQDWAPRSKLIARQLDKAASVGRPVSVVLSSEINAASPPVFQSADEWRRRISALSPVAWDHDYGAAVQWAQSMERMDVVWVSDGVERGGRLQLLEAFQKAGTVEVHQAPTPRLALKPVQSEDAQLVATVLRSTSGSRQTVTVQGIGPDPSGIERVLAAATVEFMPSDLEVETLLQVPPELRNRITRFQLEAVASSGAVSLADDTLRRRRVALLSGISAREGLELLSPLHFLREALVPSAEVIEGDAIPTLLEASPEVVILPDIPSIAEPDQKALAGWVAKGGLLLRFAGPRLAAADTGRGVEDILLPVRLRSGGRVVGGAMSWGEPRALSPFPESSPFYGLIPPEDVTVSAQILAEPSPELTRRTIASLADGTPLVTRKELGAGQVVLFHVSANAEWSSLSLSGLFVQMLERLAVSTRPGVLREEALEGTRWSQMQALDAFGQLGPAALPIAIDGPEIVQGARETVPPGIYGYRDRLLAVNAVDARTRLLPATWPSGVVTQWDAARRSLDLAPYLLSLAFMLALLDVIASLYLSGRLTRNSFRGKAARASVVIFALLLAAPDESWSQAAIDLDPELITATESVTFAYVSTGDAREDEVSEAGLRGLSLQLTYRTSVEPNEPVAIDPEMDELSVYPLIYWPILATARQPSPEAYGRLRAYLALGGFILFDTKDAGIGGESAATRRLRTIALPLGLPPLEPVPLDHVLTRSFYLLEDFPGRYTGATWVEAAPPNAERAEGMPFRNLNDGVSPVIVGGNDWVGAWAINDNGTPMFPVGRGMAGERQRELAIRFGVNLVMHVLTGNYKSDQVHVPALLQRLGE